jgi:hypothetical protein
MILFSVPLGILVLPELPKQLDRVVLGQLAILERARRP